MAFTPNIGPKTRVGYLVFGAALIAAALLGPALRSPWPWVLIAAGAVVMLEGAAGF